MKNEATTKTYLSGFIISLFLTFLAYSVASDKTFSGWVFLAVVTALALIQLIVQLIFFLHLTNEAKPRWNLVIFISTVSIILLVVIGSLWIMNHLNYHMTPSDIIRDEGLH